MKNTNELADLGGKNTEENCRTIIEMKTTPEGTRIIINPAKPRSITKNLGSGNLTQIR